MKCCLYVICLSLLLYNNIFECCSVLQCVALCCIVLHCVAVCCNVLQCVAVVWCVAYVSHASFYCSITIQSRVAVCCNVLQCAVCCNVLQCVAMCCGVLQWFGALPVCRMPLSTAL